MSDLAIVLVLTESVKLDLLQTSITQSPREWYRAMPFVCAALAGHIYHCLKFKDPYQAEKAFRGSSLVPASEQVLVDLRANLDERFEVMEAFLCQIEG